MKATKAESAMRRRIFVLLFAFNYALFDTFAPKFRIVQTKVTQYVLPTVRHRCDSFSKGAVLPRLNDAEMTPQTLYKLWRNTASIIKDLIQN